MALKQFVENVPEGLEDYYKKTDNGFVLDVEGFVPETELETYKTKAEEYKSKVNEFRSTNIELRKQLEKLMEDKGDGTPPDDTVIEEAISEMKGQLKAIAEERDRLNRQLEEVVLSDRVKDIAIRHGVHETALPDVVARARSVFTVKDGKPVPVDTKTRDENGELYNPETWLKKLQEEAPHLFKPSSGSGAHRPVNGSGNNNQELHGAQRIAAALNKIQGASNKNVM